MPTMRASFTGGHARSSTSSSAGDTLAPAVLIISLRRPVKMHVLVVVYVAGVAGGEVARRRRSTRPASCRRSASSASGPLMKNSSSTIFSSLPGSSRPVLDFIASRPACRTGGPRSTRRSPTGRSRPAAASSCRRRPWDDGRRLTCRRRTSATTGLSSPTPAVRPAPPIWCGKQYGSVTRSRAMSASASCGSNVSCITQHPPLASVAPIPVLRPAVQKIGNAIHSRVASVRRNNCDWIQNCKRRRAVPVHDALRLRRRAAAVDDQRVVVGRRPSPGADVRRLEFVPRRLVQSTTTRDRGGCRSSDGTARARAGSVCVTTFSMPASSSMNSSSFRCGERRQRHRHRRPPSRCRTAPSPLRAGCP